MPVSSNRAYFSCLWLLQDAWNTCMMALMLQSGPSVCLSYLRTSLVRTLPWEYCIQHWTSRCICTPFPGIDRNHKPAAEFNRESHQEPIFKYGKLCASTGLLNSLLRKSCRNQIWTPFFPFWSFLCLPSCFNTPHIFRHAWKLQHPKLLNRSGYHSIMPLSLPPRSGHNRPVPTSQSDTKESFTLPSRQPKRTAERKRMETVCRNMVEPQRDFLPLCCLLSSCAVFISLLSPSLPLFSLSRLTHPQSPSLPPSCAVFTVVASPLTVEKRTLFN